ncbi:MAG: hypothetical protein ABSG76_23220 [Xanthobacteraceae bacterium]
MTSTPISSERRIGGASAGRPGAGIVMQHSLITASGATHLKIMVVALVGAILVVAAGIGLHQQDVQQSSRASETIVVKAGHPMTYTRQDGSVIR